MKTSTDKSAILNVILAGWVKEAYYLKNNGWVPFIAGENISWIDPNTSVHYVQTMAVSMQRTREEQAEQKNGGDDRT